MGESIPPIPDDYDHLLDCDECYDPGKTPNYVFVRFWGITPCNPVHRFPQGYTFICSQYEDFPCEYYGEIEFEGATWWAYFALYSWAPAGASAVLQLASFDVGNNNFFYAKTGTCSFDFLNNLNFCIDGWDGEGGRGYVQIFVPPILIALTSEYHFVTQPNPLFEQQKVGMDHEMIHLASKFDKTNVLFYCDEEDYDL